MEQDVDPPPPLCHRIGNRNACLDIGQLTDHGEPAIRRQTDALRHRVEGRAVTTDSGGPGAVASEALDRDGAKSPGRPGDQDDGRVRLTVRCQLAHQRASNERFDNP